MTYRRRMIRTTRMMMARTTTPPTTPPIIAPVPENKHITCHILVYRSYTNLVIDAMSMSLNPNNWFQTLQYVKHTKRNSIAHGMATFHDK